MISCQNNHLLSISDRAGGRGVHELRSPQGSGSPKSPSCSLGFCQMPYGFSFDASSSCNPAIPKLPPSCHSAVAPYSTRLKGTQSTSKPNGLTHGAYERHEPPEGYSAVNRKSVNYASRDCSTAGPWSQAPNREDLELKPFANQLPRGGENRALPSPSSSESCYTPFVPFLPGS